MCSAVRRRVVARTTLHRSAFDFLEGDVIIVAVQRMAHRWFGRRIPFFVDNMVFEKSG